jgi:hypothetical protein
MKKVTRIRAFLFATALAVSGSAFGAAVDLSATTVGSISGLFGFSEISPTVLSTLSGVQELPQGPMGIGGVVVENRLYVTFSTSGLNTAIDPVTGATLRIVLGDYTSQGPGGTFPNFTTLHNATEQFSIYDVSTPYAELQTTFDNACGCFPPTPNAAGSAAFADLGTGNVYGTFNASNALVGADIDIPLSAQAIADINAAGNNGFAVGITFSGTEFQGFDGLFGAPLVQQTTSLTTNDAQQQLLLTTSPEPSTWLLGLTGLMVLMIVVQSRARSCPSGDTIGGSGEKCPFSNPPPKSAKP